MVVNSFTFWVFFVVVFVVYWLPTVHNKKWLQNLWLFLVSYFFYGYADWRMLPLLLCTTVVFYYLGLWIKKEMSKENWKAASHLTTLGVCLGVGVLLFFKYFNFFGNGIARLLQAFGLNVSWTTLNIIVPVGVSFFTFKLISYVIEIHRERIEPTRDFITFATFIAFFPTILSGPIDRPNKFIPQLEKNRSFDYSLAVDGCRQVLWGMFTKMCIADNIAMFTGRMWNDYTSFNGIDLLGGVILLPIQVYTDFSGYSDMAIGVSKILGLRVTRNFKHPFIARNVAEFWQRWHISLTTWITDYVFMPLNIAFRNIGKTGVILAVIINMMVIGFWHGANWTYGLFGLYHGLLFVPLILSGTFGKNKKVKPNKYGLPHLKDFMFMLLTYMLVAFGLIVWSAPSLHHVLWYVQSMIIGLTAPQIHFLYLNVGYTTYFFILILLIYEWRGRNVEHPLQLLGRGIFAYTPVRYTLYVVMCVAMLIFSGVHSDFIYFQF